jgi:competence protein ComEA
MVTTAQLHHSVGLTGSAWEPPDDDTDEPPREWSRPARLTIASVIGLALVGLGLTAIGVIISSTGNTHTVTLDHIPETPSSISTVSPPPPPSTVIIHVIGQVYRPGIVELDDGARVIDAIEASGGVTQEADLDMLNLARILTDGEQVYVPAVGEDVAARPSPPGQQTAGPISLSRADQATLETLPGVGPALAARIIAWREANGPFQSVADVLAVSGIGPATLERFADQVVP